MLPPSILKPQPYRVVQNRVIGEGVYLLQLVPQTPEGFFVFEAGQWCNVHFPDFEGKPWRKGAFSIASAPSESQQRLEFAIKIEGEMTQRGSKLMVGDIIGLQGPFGKFILPSSDRSMLFLAGGIGVAPFRSMIRERVSQSDARSMTLIHSNRMQAGSVFVEEFSDLARSYPQFRYIPVLTGDTDSDWTGERGRITPESLTRLVPELVRCDVLMCASKEFMDSMRVILTDLGVSLDRIFVERFY